MNPGPRIPQRRVLVSHRRCQQGASEPLALDGGGGYPRRDYFLRLNIRVSFYSP